MRERSRVLTASQEKLSSFGRSFWNVPISWQDHPAPSSDTRDETRLPRAAARSTSTMTLSLP